MPIKNEQYGQTRQKREHHRQCPALLPHLHPLEHPVIKELGKRVYDVGKDDAEEDGFEAADKPAQV